MKPALDTYKQVEKYMKRQLLCCANAIIYAHAWGQLAYDHDSYTAKWVTSLPSRCICQSILRALNHQDSLSSTAAMCSQDSICPVAATRCLNLELQLEL